MAGQVKAPSTFAVASLRMPETVVTLQSDNAVLFVRGGGVVPRHVLPLDLARAFSKGETLESGGAAVGHSESTPTEMPYKEFIQGGGLIPRPVLPQCLAHEFSRGGGLQSLSRGTSFGEETKHNASPDLFLSFARGGSVRSIPELPLDLAGAFSNGGGVPSTASDACFSENMHEDIIAVERVLSWQENTVEADETVISAQHSQTSQYRLDNNMTRYMMGSGAFNDAASSSSVLQSHPVSANANIGADTARMSGKPRSRL